jgi:hypothetical protein
MWRHIRRGDDAVTVAPKDQHGDPDAAKAVEELRVVHIRVPRDDAHRGNVRPLDALPPAAEISTPAHDESVDPEERIARATEAFLRLVLKQEALVRAVMALSLLQSVETPGNRRESVAIRPGYRMAWIAEALAPLEGKIAPAVLHRLTDALAIVVSSEALVTLEDVRGRDADAAVDTCVWAARTLVRAVIADQGGELSHHQ